MKENKETPFIELDAPPTRCVCHQCGDIAILERATTDVDGEAIYKCNGECGQSIWVRWKV